MKSMSPPLSQALARPRLICGLFLMLLALLAQNAARAADSEPPVFDAPVMRNDAPQMRHEAPELSLVQTFLTQPGDRSVSVLLERWARQVGVGMIWDAKSDVTLVGQDRFTGTFEQAVERLLSGVAGVNLQACIHVNTPPVIRITESGSKCE